MMTKNLWQKKWTAQLALLGCWENGTLPPAWGSFFYYLHLKLIFLANNTEGGVLVVAAGGHAAGLVHSLHRGEDEKIPR